MDRPGRLDHRILGMWSGAAAAVVEGLAGCTPFVENEIRGLRRLVGPGSVCVDVGAAAGLYTVALARLAGPAGRVHSIEPLAFANRAVARLLAAGHAGNVRRHAVALGAHPGTDFMSVPVGRFGPVTGRSFLDRDAFGPDPNVEFRDRLAVSVDVDTLDSLCLREGFDRLDFVKIDVEGAELDVLRGGKGVIEALRPALLIEIEARHTARYGRTPADVTGWLFDLGYRMQTWRGGWYPADSIGPHVRNYLFRPSPRPAGRPEGRHRVGEGTPMI